MRLLAPAPQFRHEALFYADQDAFLDGTSSFIRDALEADEPSLVVLQAAKLEALRSELGDSADRVMFADMAQVGGNPARIIHAWNEFVKQHAGRNVRGIGEPIWAERTPAELIECQRHESLLNLAFADTPGFHLLCPYDTSALPPEVIEEAQRSHPHLSCAGESEESPCARGIEEIKEPFTAPLPEPMSVPHSKVFQALTLGALRDFVAHQAADLGLDRRSTQDLVIAANEVATNSVVHGGGGGVARVWQDENAVVCEVDDAGHIDDPMIGRQPPEHGAESGHGLWMANQLCDLVQVRSYRGGSAVRLHQRLA